AHRHSVLMAVHDFPILNAIEYAESKQLQRYTEAEISLVVFGLEVWLRQVGVRADPGLRCGEYIRSAHDREKLVHPAVRSPVGPLRESHFAYRAVSRQE